MQRIYFLLIAMTFSTVAVGQITISGSVGYGSYEMAQLKESQEELKNNFGVEGKITSAFPAYWYYQFDADFTFKANILVGVTCAYGSTGGKVDYEDYSGGFHYEHRLSYITVGVPVGYRFNLQPEKLTLRLEVRPTVYFSETELEYESHLGGQTSQSGGTYKGYNLGLHPNARLDRKVGPLLLFVQAGYFLDLSRSKLILKGSSDQPLMDSQGDPVRASFFGFRMSTGVALRINL
jgi:hypothetical protein